MASEPGPWWRSPLGRYRVMAWVVGIMLIAVFALIPFSRAEAVIGPIHGILYIAYLATVLNAFFAYRFGLPYLVGMVVAGWCPFLSFVMERLITRRFRPATPGYDGPAPLDKESQSNQP